MSFAIGAAAGTYAVVFLLTYVFGMHDSPEPAWPGYLALACAGVAVAMMIYHFSIERHPDRERRERENR